MAMVRPSLSRLAASCVELDCARRLPALRTRAVNVGYGFKSSFDEGTRLFKNSRPSCSPYSLCNDVHVGLTVGCRSRGNVRSRVCSHLRGFLTAAGSDNGEARPATHVLRVPSLGESITEGTVVEWRRGIGSVVQAEEVVCVLETDKVSVDIPADITGRIVSIAVEVGGTAFVGGDLAIIEPLSPEAAGEADSAPAAPERPAAPAAAQSASGFHTGGPATDRTAAPADSHSRHEPRRPLIAFRSMRARLERLGILPAQQQGESPTESKGHKQEKQKTKRLAEEGSSATVVM